MSSPILSAFFHPLHLAALAVASAAGLCAAWWLFPIGVIVWGLMVYTYATDPTVRRLQAMHARAPVAQRFQQPFDRLERAQVSIYQTISGAHRGLRPLLEPLRVEVDSLVDRAHHVCARMTVLENYRSVQSFGGKLESELGHLDVQIATATDAATKAEYEESRRDVQKRIDSLKAIGLQSDRVEAQLASLSAALASLHAELIRMHALGPDVAGQLIPAHRRNLGELSAELTRFEQEISSLSV